MQRTDAQTGNAELPQPGLLSRALDQGLFLLFAGATLFFIVRQWSTAEPASYWVDALLLIVAGLSTCASFCRQLPVQNVLFIGMASAVVGFLAYATTSKFGVPFGPVRYLPEAGWQLAGVVPWPLPLMWIVVVLASRGAAKALLAPWRSHYAYGYFILAAGGALSALLVFAFHAYATTVQHYWTWESGSRDMASAWKSGAAGGLLAMLTLAALGPWFLTKRASALNQPTSWKPFWAWAGLLACAVYSLSVRF